MKKNTLRTSMAFNPKNQQVSGWQSNPIGEIEWPCTKSRKKDQWNEKEGNIPID
jgi:hypothetical protein